MKRVQMAGWAAAAMLAVSAGAIQAQAARQWQIDPYHSEADFQIRHMGLSTVHGSFRGVTGKILLDPQNIGGAYVEAWIDVASVDTGVPPRDTHLKSPDFFDVAKYPTMSFKSTHIDKGPGWYDVSGDLILHGVTKRVVLRLEPLGKEQVGMDKKIHRGFTATTIINRKDFGLTWNGTVGSGDAVLSDEVKIELDIEATLI